MDKKARGSSAERAAHTGAPLKTVLILLLFAALAFAAPARPAFAQDGEITLYVEQFDDDQAQGWDLGSNRLPAWSVQQGRMVAPALPAAQVLQNQRASTACYPLAIFGDSDLIFRFSPDEIGVGSALEVDLRTSPDEQSGYRVYIRREDKEQYFLQIAKRSPNGSSLLPLTWTDSIEGVGMTGERARIAFYLGYEHTASIAVYSGKISISFYPIGSFDGPPSVPVYTAADADPPGAGGICFATQAGSGVWLDDVVVAGEGQNATYFIDGQVWQGEQEGRPAAGIPVQLVDIHNAGLDPGSVGSEMKSLADGSFRLAAHPGNEFYSLRLADAPGFTPLRAVSETGEVIGPAQVDLQGPLWQRLPAGIAFFVQVPPTATPTSADTPTLLPENTSTPAPTLTETPTPPALPTLPEATPAVVIPNTAPTESPTGPGCSGLDCLGSPAVLLAVTALLAAALGASGFALFRWLFRKPPGPSATPPRPTGPRAPDRPRQPEERRPGNPPPVLPPVRLMRLWLTQPNGLPLGPAGALTVGANYQLNMQFQAFSQTPEQASGPEAQAGGGWPLRVVLFAPPEDLAVERSSLDMLVPPRGSSPVLAQPLRVLRSGVHRVRACVYFGAVLLQSGYVELSAAAPGEPDPGGARPASFAETDYAASVSLTGLQRFPQPSLSIFTNQAADGTHWIGTYAPNTGTGPDVKNGLLKTFDTLRLTALADQIREMLAVIQGSQPYRYDFPEGAAPALRIERLEQDMIRLAKCAWRVYHSLFLEEGDEDDWDRLPTQRKPGIVSIARCQNGPSIPWAALYDLPLYENTPVKLCEYFKSEMAQMGSGLPAREPGFRPRGGEIPCYGKPHCPLVGPDRRTTVCPFGFWGFTHQIEQPMQSLQMVQAPGDALVEMDQKIELVTQAAQPVRVALGIHPNIAGVNNHLGALNGIASARRAVLALSQDRTQVLQMLLQPGYQFYYFYCHGRGVDQQFRLVFGPAGQETFLAASDLDPRQDRWRGDPHPLVVMNGCETMKLTPEVIQGFLGTLRGMGAYGVVGSEIPIHVRLAMPFGQMLMDQMLAGASVGEAFLSLRQALLEQGNPLGLVYTYYSPAALHLHDAQNCAWCSTHNRPQ